MNEWLDFTRITDRVLEFRQHMLAFLETEAGRNAVLSALAVICLLVVLWIFGRLRQTNRDKSLARETRGAKLAGYAIVALFFGGFGTWAATAPLSSAAIALGVISPDGSRKTVQHLEGGIIQQIYVQEGDSVKQGDPLVALRQTQALAQYNELRERRLFLLAAEARLIAEQMNSQSINFSGELREDSSEFAREAMDSQSALFEQRRSVQQAREQILGRRIAQLDEEIAGLEDVIAAQDEQLELIEQELSGMTTLYDKGLSPLPRILALRREEADLRGSKAGNRATIARNRQAIGETELQLIASQQQLQEAASDMLTKVRAEISSVQSQLPQRFDALERTTILAPIDGRVMNIRVTTESSGVIAPGEPILEIVPDDAQLIVDARVRPQDIDVVYVGMRARVILTALNQRYLPQLYGELRSISADRFTDERSGEPYFLAKISVDPQEFASLGEHFELVAGMPAEVMLLAGERTFVDMILRPLSNSVRRSFRDDS